MSDLSYMIWFLATAAMTITVLTAGTLAAAGMLPGREHGRRHTAPRRRAPDRVALTQATASDAVHRTRPAPAGLQEHPDHEHRAA
jgi:hypothetical protein